MFTPEASQLNESSLRANFNEAQTDHFNRLMDELEHISQGYGFQEIKAIAEAGDPQALKVLRQYVSKKEQVVCFIERKIILVQDIRATTPEGVEVEFHLQEQLRKWQSFFMEKGIDWVDWPQEIKVSQETQEQMQKLIERAGFNRLAVIPEGVVGDPDFEESIDGKGRKINKLVTPAEHYSELFRKMTVGSDYNPPDFFKSDLLEGGIDGTLDTRKDLRLVLFTDVPGHDGCKHTKSFNNESWEALQRRKPMYPNIDGLTLSEYFILERDHFDRTGQHLFTDSSNICSASVRPATDRVPTVRWGTQNNRILFKSRPKTYEPDSSRRSSSRPSIITKTAGVFPAEAF